MALIFNIAAKTFQTMGLDLFFCFVRWLVVFLELVCVRSFFRLLRKGGAKTFQTMGFVLFFRFVRWLIVFWSYFVFGVFSTFWKKVEPKPFKLWVLFMFFIFCVDLLFCENFINFALWILHYAFLCVDLWFWKNKLMKIFVYENQPQLFIIHYSLFIIFLCVEILFIKNPSFQTRNACPTDH